MVSRSFRIGTVEIHAIFTCQIPAILRHEGRVCDRSFLVPCHHPVVPILADGGAPTGPGVRYYHLRFQIFVEVFIENLMQFFFGGVSQSHAFEQIVLIHERELRLALQFHQPPCLRLSHFDLVTTLLL